MFMCFAPAWPQTTNSYLCKMPVDPKINSAASTEDIRSNVYCHSLCCPKTILHDSWDCTPCRPYLSVCQEREAREAAEQAARELAEKVLLLITKFTTKCWASENIFYSKFSSANWNYSGNPKDKALHVYLRKVSWFIIYDHFLPFQKTEPPQVKSHPLALTILYSSCHNPFQSHNTVILPKADSLNIWLLFEPSSLPGATILKLILYWLRFHS